MPRAVAYPTLRATRLFDMVKPRGYPGEVRTLRAYVATVRLLERLRDEVFVRLHQQQPLCGRRVPRVQTQHSPHHFRVVIQLC